jgi:pyruvate/2-oxoacid:ferredoxin oxidoreductase alpha subunit
MTIEVWTAADSFTANAAAETIAVLDLESSYRNFERLLNHELQRIYPNAEITAHVSGVNETTVYIDHEDIASSERLDARTVFSNIHYAMDKLFFDGRFWVDRNH